MAADAEAFTLVGPQGERIALQTHERAALRADRLDRQVQDQREQVAQRAVLQQDASRLRQGKAFYYSARIPKTTALQALTRGLAKVFAKGSMRELIAQLVDTSDITPDDLKTIRAAAAGKPPTKPK